MRASSLPGACNGEHKALMTTQRRENNSQMLCKKTKTKKLRRLHCDFCVPGDELERVPFLCASISLHPYACLPCSGVTGCDGSGRDAQYRCRRNAASPDNVHKMRLLQIMLLHVAKWPGTSEQWCGWGKVEKVIAFHTGCHISICLDTPALQGIANNCLYTFCFKETDSCSVGVSPI